MKKLPARELLWITLPIVLLGGVWLVPLLHQQQAGLPIGLEKGPPRLELSQWTRLTPRTIDFARGLSASVQVDGWNGGQCPASSGPVYNEGIDFPPGNLYFSFLRNGRWQTQRIRWNSSRMDWLAFERPYAPTSGSNASKWQRYGEHIEMHLPMNQLPHDAKEVHLTGRFEGYMWCQNGPEFKTQSPPIDVLLKSPQEEWPTFTGMRQPSLRLLRTQQAPIINPTNYVPYKPTVEVTAFLKPQTEQDSDLFIASSWIEDADGKFLFRAEEERTWSTPFTIPCRWKLNMLHLDGKAPFTLKSYISTSPDKWPLLVKIPLKIKSTKQAR